MSTLVPVILAGGGGTRLRPLSSSSKPKQFLKLVKDVDDTLFQSSVRRALMVAEPSNIITIALDEYKGTIYKQLAVIDKKLNRHVILEPFGRNTAAAIAAAAVYAANNFDDPILWVIPSDHLIINDSELKTAVQKTTNAARHGKIAVFGIEPTRADSNYGYIIGGDPLKYHTYMHSVRKFIEKPKGENLKWALEQKNCWWNSGMFVLSAYTLFREMKRKGGNTLKAASLAYKYGRQSQYGFHLNDKCYALMESLPIDKLVMETSLDLVVHPVNIGWSDVGSWHSLWELSQQEGRGRPLDNFLEKLERAA